MKGRKRFLIKQVSIPILKGPVIIVIDFNCAIFYLKSIGIVFTYFVVMNFGDPTAEILSVEKNLPLRLRRLYADFFVFGFLTREEKEDGKKRKRIGFIVFRGWFWELFV